MRWMSPELLDPDQFGRGDGRPTKDSDCYALGMVILEVLTSKPPFLNDNNLIVMRKIIEGERPGRPQGKREVWFTEDLWEMLERCWSPQPEERPAIDAVLQCLRQGSIAWQPLPPDSDDHAQSDSDDQSDFTSSHDPSIGLSMFLHFVLHREKGETLMMRNEGYKPPITYPRVVNLTRGSRGQCWLDNALFRRYIVNRVQIHFLRSRYGL